MRSIFIAFTVMAVCLAAWHGSDASSLALSDARIANGIGSVQGLDGLLPDGPSAPARIGCAMLFILFVIWRKSRLPL